MRKHVAFPRTDTALLAFHPAPAFVHALTTAVSATDDYDSVSIEERTLYSLRHSYTTFQILNGVDMATLAVQMGTSIGMLEKHYSKLKPYMKLATLNGMQESSSSPAIEKLERLIAQQGDMIREILKRL